MASEPMTTPELSTLSEQELDSLERTARSECNEYRSSVGRATCSLRKCLIHGGWVSGSTKGHEPMCEAKQILRLIAQARAARPSPWQPMETAPTDGTVFLAFAPAAYGLSALYALCAWHPDAGFFVDELREATHWQPLPSPPAQDGGRP